MDIQPVAGALMTTQPSDVIQFGAWTSADPDRAAARWLPDEYVAIRRMPSVKIMELINRAWSRYPDGDRRQLAQALLGILAPMDVGEPVTSEVRTLCERTVIQWRERIKAKTYGGTGTPNA